MAANACCTQEGTRLIFIKNKTRGRAVHWWTDGKQFFLSTWKFFVGRLCTGIIIRPLWSFAAFPLSHTVERNYSFKWFDYFSRAHEHFLLDVYFKLIWHLVSSALHERRAQMFSSAHSTIKRGEKKSRTLCLTFKLLLKLCLDLRKENPKWSRELLGRNVRPCGDTWCVLYTFQTVWAARR